ncbi:MAG TPA: hypothetical protein VF588_17005 [Pyrinomonadaceae bacterium]|jgi:hypothetical protein
MASRLLKESEVEFARQVFEDKLPYDKIYLSSNFFPFNKGTAVTVASAAAFVPVRTWRSYTIFFGPDPFEKGADIPDHGHVFIHELTHVWQGFHGVLGWEYMAQSMLAQGYAILTQGSRHKAYSYDPGAPWGSYNVEQQAFLVEHWYERGMNPADDRFPYIANHIRAGRT